jgi:hypothetical protein
VGRRRIVGVLNDAFGFLGASWRLELCLYFIGRGFGFGFGLAALHWSMGYEHTMIELE